MMENQDKYIGQIFDNRYRIMKIIGVGGMAIVYEAYDMLMKRNVAIKLLKEAYTHDPEAVKRFVNESKAVSMLSHPNIVGIYDISVREDLKYIVMERVEGISLKSYMTRKGELPLKESLSYIEQILRALEHAHSKGIIHRDIKPQNIMLLKNGRIKVADFGIAKLPNTENLTMSDKAIGTVYYVSPEQASGKTIDPRSDLYSLGVMMYEMLAGRLPFEAESPVTVAMMQVNDSPRPPRELKPELSPGLEQVILISMEKDPACRFQSASQMLKQIMQIKANPEYVPKPIRAPSKGDKKGRKPKKSTPKSTKNYMLPIILGVLTAFLLTAAVSLVVLLTPPEESQSKTIEVRDLIGLVYSDDLQKELESQHYKITIEREYSADAKENTIIEQSLEPGEKRTVQTGKSYCDITLTLSMGAEKVSLPDVTVTKETAARNALEKLGLKCESTEEQHNTVLAGYVIRSEPEAGTTLNVGETVKIYVSSGPQIEKVQVPDFADKTEAEAKSMLVSSGLSLGEYTYQKSDTVEKSKIISQSLAAGTEVAKGTKINFVISEGA